MDLSKVPDLELRQKIKPINDRLDAIEAELERVRIDEYEKTKAICVPLRNEHESLSEQLEELLGEDRSIEGTCDLTGLPIFNDDETIETSALACVADAQKAAA